MKDFIRKLLREDLGYSYVVGSAINDEYQLTEDDDLTQQLFILSGGEILNLNKLPKGKLKIKNDKFKNKPYGAFWTSTHNKYGSDWFELSKMYSDNIPKKGLILTPKPSASILYIKNDVDYEKAYETFPNISKIPFSKWLDWESVSKKYDGVNVSASALYNKNLTYWDVESTCWFNMDTLKINKIIDIN